MTFFLASKLVGRFLFRETAWFILLLAFGIALGCGAIYFFGTPDVTHISEHPLHQASILYDRTGTHELYRLFGEENRTVLPHDDIPDAMRFATIASEDARFFSHIGVDPFAILRAIKINVSENAFEQGGSTITQQLARNLFLNRERTLDRKIREAVLAIKIEQRLDKNAILDLYLNTVPYGANAYGVGTAAETYFGKKARDLSIDESALLTVLPNAPTRLSPYGDAKNELLARQRFILRRMKEFGFIDEQTFKIALGTDTLKKIRPLERTIIAPHFVFSVIERLEKYCNRECLETDGVHIVTTLDYDLQREAEAAVRMGAERNARYGAENAALVALDSKKGDVLALVGSKDYFAEDIDGNVNVALRSRQPGSAFKPFAYASAFEQGFQPETLIVDRPINFGPDGSGREYIPRNYDGRFHGILTFRQALAQSLNVPAVQVLALAGINKTVDLARRLGITTLTDPSRYGLALVLGGAEVKPLEMAAAFSVFGQDGIRYEPAFVQEIKKQDGSLLFQKDNLTGERALDADVAQKINSILSDNVARTPIFGPKSPLAFPADILVAGKTGTTQNFRDAWTVGYTPFVAVAVWVGNNDNRPMRPGADGIFVAAPIWRQFFDAALKRFPKTGFTPYERAASVKSDLPIRQTETKTLFIDRKTGREISEEKAKKLKKSRVEKKVIEEFPVTETVTERFFRP